MDHLTSVMTGNAWGALAGIYGVLAAASLVWGALRIAKPQADLKELRDRIASWWVMIGLVTVPLLLGAEAFILLMAFISFIALREYVSIIPIRREDRPVIFIAYLSIVVNYALVWLGFYGIFLIFVPVYIFLMVPFAMALMGQTKNYLASMGALHWGVMTTVYNLGYVAYLMRLPEACNPAGGGAGLVLFLLIATQGNDVAQYVWGKTLGSRKILPTVSPNKTWEGFLGGLATTTAFAAIVGPLLTPFSGASAALVGLVIGLAGFAGDVTISAVKRDLGVKDTSNLIPGHGGALDRLDSLAFTAPLFFHILVYFFFGFFATCQPQP